MAEKLSITIGLEGGKELQRQLADIGKAGQQAFLEIQKAAEKAGGFTKLDPAQVVAFTDKLKSMGIVGEQAFNQISSALASATRTERLVGAVQAVENGFASLASGAAAFARALGPIGATAGLALGGIVKVAADAATALQKADAQAKILGLTFQQFDQLKKSFEQTGAAADAIADGITHAAQAVEKLKLDRVATLFKAASSVGRDESDFTRSIALLKQMAAGVGLAAEAAQKALVDLGEAQAKVGSNLSPMEQLFRRLGVAVGDSATMIEQAKAKLATLPDTLQRTADAITLLGPKLGVEFVQGLQAAAGAMDPAVAASVRLEQQWNRLGTRWKELKTDLGGRLLTMLEADIGDLEKLNNLLKADTWFRWGKQAKEAIDTVAIALGGILWEGFESAGTAAIEGIVSALDFLLGKLSAIGRAIKGIWSGGGEPGSVTPAPGNASGGYIRGPGTATSDSILARLSNGEFVVSARAVQHWGVGFLSSLNNLQTPRFSMGGLAQMPRFAAGGLVGGMPHLGTVDLTTNHGLVRVAVDDGGLKQLRKAAVMRNMGADRKPGWVR